MKSRLDVAKVTNPTLEIQLYLRDISQNNPDIPKVLPTGTYDRATQVAVAEFQKKHNLPITGKVDLVTWKKIVDEHNILMQSTGMPNCVSCFPSNINKYERGSTENLIYILQLILKNYHKKFKNYPDVHLTGEFDEQTENALKIFQKNSNLPETGVLDRQTWNILNKINHICKLYE